MGYTNVKVIGGFSAALAFVSIVSLSAKFAVRANGFRADAEIIAGELRLYLARDGLYKDANARSRYSFRGQRAFAWRTRTSRLPHKWLSPV